MPEQLLLKSETVTSYTSYELCEEHPELGPWLPPNIMDTFRPFREALGRLHEYMLVLYHI